MLQASITAGLPDYYYNDLRAIVYENQISFRVESQKYGLINVILRQNQ